mmetsp:Transcript_51096/g.109159  ORF Transcript_51096/g.109159 Transcript_51096/m.109159 type:complete len:329 (-) Transcript_51096:728-1714(-)
MVRVQLPLARPLAYSSPAHSGLQGDDEDARRVQHIGRSLQVGAAARLRGVVEVRRGHVRRRRHVPGEVSRQDQHGRAHQVAALRRSRGQGWRSAAERCGARGFRGEQLQPHHGGRPADARCRLTGAPIHRDVADADHRQRRVGRRQQHDPHVEPVHAAWRQAHHRARRRQARAELAREEKGSLPALVRHPLHGTRARRRRGRGRACPRQVPLAARQGRLRGHHPRGRLERLLRHDFRLTWVQGRRPRAGAISRGDPGGGIRRWPHPHRLRHQSLPAPDEGEVHRPDAQVLSLRARAVYRLAPAGPPRLLEGARNGGGARAVLVEEAQA